MSNGPFEAFLDVLRAFESGWDRDRYEAGIIADWQLDQWAGGPVTSRFPQYSSWGDLTDAEWDAMSYRSMNSLGFVGYQFGEALLIDLGYYDDDVFYGNGAAANTWDGIWTGKNGVESLETFMTGAAQEIAIREAFGYNLQIIETGLAAQGTSLEALLGTTASYQQNGQTVEVELTLTGLMAAAHLRGAWGTLSLLQAGAVSTDEFGTSILQYVEQFGGYDAPSVAEAIAFFTDRLTGDEGLGTPNGTPPPGVPGSPQSDPGTGTPSVTKETADLVLTWAWGEDRSIADFDPTADTIFVDWIGADALEIQEANGSVTFAVPSNNQQTTLLGVSLTDLSPANFTILDATAAAEIVALIGDEGAADPAEPDPPADTPTDPGDGHNGHGGTMTEISLTFPSRIVEGFNPMIDMIHILSGVTGPRFEIFEEAGDALGQTVRIAVTAADGTPLSTTVFPGLGLADLTLGNFSVAEQGVLNEVASALGQVIGTPGPETGFPVSYDSDGSAPPQVTGETAAGGQRWRADTNADDIVGFDPQRDALDFGSTSVHGLILTKTPAGEIAIDSPWSAAMQIVQGVGYDILTIESFGVVGNEHLRQDIGGVVSWELGLGPRQADTVYVRSHEYGVAEVVDGFDPATMKISFLYFGTRERLVVEETAVGLRISSLPTGQSLTLTGVALADLAPGRVEFHHDQVMEDNLEVPFGFAQDDVTLVDRTVLLTPAAPAGETTDGQQTRTGVMTPGGANPPPTDDEPVGDEPAAPTPPSVSRGSAGVTQDTADVAIGWAWGTERLVEGFDPASDTIFIDWIPAEALSVSETAEGVVFAVPSNAQATVLAGVGLADLSAANFTIMDAGAAAKVLGLIAGPADIEADPPSPEVPGHRLSDPLVLDWNWGVVETVVGFDPAADQIDFGHFSAGQIAIAEADEGLVIEIVGNGGQAYLLVGQDAEALQPQSLAAAEGNGVLAADGGVIDQLEELGFDSTGF
ncbi:MAG: 1,4-beta-glucanase [Pseudomonadota bacterium]